MIGRGAKAIGGKAVSDCDLMEKGTRKADMPATVHLGLSGRHELWGTSEKEQRSWPGLEGFLGGSGGNWGEYSLHLPFRKKKGPEDISDDVQKEDVLARKTQADRAGNLKEERIWGGKKSRSSRA